MQIGHLILFFREQGTRRMAGVFLCPVSGACSNQISLVRVRVPITSHSLFGSAF